MTETERKTAYGRIHKAAAQLGLDDGDYRGMLERITGKTSCKDMTGPELEKLQRYLIRSGADVWVTVPDGKPKLLWKLRDLLESMDLPFAYADGIARKMFGVDKIQFLTPEQMGKVVAALIYRKRKIINDRNR